MSRERRRSVEKRNEVIIAGLAVRRLRRCFGIVLARDPQSSPATVTTGFIPGIKGELQGVACLEAQVLVVLRVKPRDKHCNLLGSECFRAWHIETHSYAPQI